MHPVSMGICPDGMSGRSELWDICSWERPVSMGICPDGMSGKSELWNICSPMYPVSMGICVDGTHLLSVPVFPISTILVLGPITGRRTIIRVDSKVRILHWEWEWPKTSSLAWCRKTVYQNIFASPT